MPLLAQFALPSCTGLGLRLTAEINKLYKDHENAQWPKGSL